VLAHHAVQGSRGAKLSVEGRVRVDDAIDSSRITKWTAAIDEPGRELLAQGAAARLGAFFGYDMRDPLKLEPVRRGKRLLIRGRDIKRRILEFPDVDVATQPLVPKFDRVYHPSEVTLIEALPEVEPAPPGPLRRALRPAVRVLPAGVRRRISAAANVDTRAAPAAPDPEDAAP